MLPEAVREYKEEEADSEPAPSEAEASEPEEGPEAEAELISGPREEVWDPAIPIITAAAV